MIIFIWGSDTTGAGKKVDHLVGQFQKKRDESGLNIVYLDGTDIADFEHLSNVICSTGFLADKKLIVIKNIIKDGNEKVLKPLLDMLKKHSEDDNHLLFWESTDLDKTNKTQAEVFAFLKKQKFSYHFPQLKGKDLSRWIIKAFRERGLQVQFSVAERLAFYFEGNMNLLYNEIDKISNYKQKGMVTEEDIDKVIYVMEKEDIFPLIDAILLGDKKQALELLNRQLKVYDLGFIFNMLLRNVKIVMQIRLLLEEGLRDRDISQKINAHPYMIKKSTSIARKTSLRDIQKMFRYMEDIDRKVKSGHPYQNILLDLLILEN